MRPACHSARGVVLATVVLLLFAVTLVAHAALVFTRAYREGGDEMWAAVRVRRAVAGRVDLAVLAGDTTASGWSPTGAGVETRLDPVALSPEVTLLAGSGRSARAGWWAGRVVWRADPLTRGASLGAAVRVGGSLRTPPGTASVTATPGGVCPADVGPRPTLPLGPEGLGVGPLDAAALGQRMDAWTGVAPPAPCPAGGCPSRLAVATGPLTLSGGGYSGLLLVRGDVTLADSAEWRGMILAEGSLTLLGSARITGAVQVLGDVLIGSSGGIYGDPCVVAGLWAGGLADRLGPVALDRRSWALWGPPP